ncbi:MAG TPA: putative zinc-binding protein [Clostridiales bacterium]|nr:putative zinc-binding protein [Clostridiales bacterium]HQP69158.1 putative zinc-binding protein [Clostridiales bacterium]
MADCGCGCGGGIKLVYACSGCADVGDIADRIARKLKRDGSANMTCLAGLGADLSGFVESAKSADINITVDGCGVLCAKKTLQRHSIEPMSFCITQMGLLKGKTPVSDEIVNEISELIKEKIE